MDIKLIINEEVTGWLDEVGGTREPFPYEKVKDGNGYVQYDFRVEVPEKNYNKTYEVTLYNLGNPEEIGYSISFDEKGRGYSSTNLGQPLRIMATVSAIVKEFVAERQPDVLSFAPTREGRDFDNDTNRRLHLYHRFVKQGAGGQYEGYVVGKERMMTVEKRDPSFELVMGIQSPETIQNIVKDLTLYGGRYVTPDLDRNDPEYKEFIVASSLGTNKLAVRDGTGRSKTTGSATKFVDWVLTEGDVVYVEGDEEPTRRTEPEPESVDAPIQRIGGNQGSIGVAPTGTFQHFLNNHVYGQRDYRVLQPFLRGMDSIEKFDDLKSKAERQLWTADETERERLQDIVTAVNKLRRTYDSYESSQNHRRLNEIESNLLDLIK